MGLQSEDLVKFRDWLELNVESISWEGRYIHEFNMFWDQLFSPEIEYSDQVKRIQKAKEIVKSGPVYSWFEWLENKFIIFIYIEKNLSLSELSEVSSREVSEIAVELRNFFCERFPHLTDYFSEVFLATNITCLNLNLNFENINQETHIKHSVRGSLEDEILTDLEITLYDEWNKVFNFFCDNIERDSQKNQIYSTSRGKKFMREVLIFVSLAGALVFGVKYGNKWYEDYLISKITLFEPTFFWLDKNLTFRSQNPLSEDNISLSFKELENLERLEAMEAFNLDESDEQRFEVESDVFVTSVGDLPKNLDTANLELSDYEEKRKTDYRDSRYGRYKAYRVLMNSVNPSETSSSITKILENYGAKQVSNVRPGTKIPGGIYYNLYVPRKNLKSFLSEVNSSNDARVMISQTRFGAPYGMNKVFIWIKSI